MSILKRIFTGRAKNFVPKEAGPETPIRSTNLEDLGKNSTPQEEPTTNCINSIVDVGAKLAGDPLISDAERLFIKIAKRYERIVTGLLDNSAVFLGIGAGLFGMSLVAVIFHFIRSVVNLDTSDILQSVSYGVFFACLIFGIFKNRGENRIITRLNTKHLKAQDQSMRQQQKMKSYYEDLLKDKMTEKEKSDTGHRNIQQKHDEQLNEAGREILILQTKIQREKFSFKRFFKPKQKNN